MFGQRMKKLRERGIPFLPMTNAFVHREIIEARRRIVRAQRELRSVKTENQKKEYNKIIAEGKGHLDEAERLLQMQKFKFTGKPYWYMAQVKSNIATQREKLNKAKIAGNRQLETWQDQEKKLRELGVRVLQKIEKNNKNKLRNKLRSKEETKRINNDIRRRLQALKSL